MSESNGPILLVSRGRGRGHAMQDLEVMRALRTQAPRLHIRVASYASGATTFRQAGEDVIDLGLGEKGSYPEAVVRVSELIRHIRPVLLTAHEELGALTAASLFQTPSILLTHYFLPPTHTLFRAQMHANRVYFLEHSGMFVPPRQLLSKVTFIGPLVRKLKVVGGTSTGEVRRRYGIPTDAFLITVLPGSPLERETPIFELVRDAVGLLTHSNKHLLWIAGLNYPSLKEASIKGAALHMIEFADDVAQLMLTSNVIVTKGTYNTTNELCLLGRTSIALSHGRNPVDDAYARQKDGVTFLKYQDTTPQRLATVLSTHGSAPQDIAISRDVDGTNAANLAALILDSYRSLVSSVAYPRGYNEV